MSLEAGTLIAMAIGMSGAAALTAWAVWSKYQEDKERDERR